MASYSDNERPRYPRERRAPRYVDESDSDDYGPPRREPRRRPRPEEPPVKPSRRRSILVDPEETASQKQLRTRTRSKSGVRLQTSSDDETDYRRSTRDARDPPRRSHRDLERKNSEDNVRFRKKRDGYESDEGDTLRRSRSAREPDRSRRNKYDEPPEYYGYERDPYGGGETLRPPRAGADAATALPIRSRRRGDPEEPPVAYGGAPVPLAMPEPGVRTAEYARDTLPSRRERPRDYEDPYGAAPPRREERERRGHSRRDPEQDEDRGYRSDNPARRRHETYDRHDRDDRDDRRYEDPYDRRPREPEPRSGGTRRRAPTYDDYLSDHHRGDRARRYERETRGDRERYRDYDYDRKDKRRDYDRPRGYGDDRDRSGKKRSPAWQKEAGVLFTTYAMPLLKDQGAKVFKDQMSKFLAKKGAA